MKRYIAFVLSALTCANLCACGANPQLDPVEEEPAAPIVEEVVVPEESVVQEVSATTGNISLMYKGMSVRNGESIYLAEGTEMLSVSAGRKKLDNYTVTSSNPNAYQCTINEDGSIALTCVGKGESIITISTDNQNAVFIACTPSNLELRFGDTVIDSETEIKIPFEDYTEKVNVIVNDKAISNFEMTASEESFFVEYEKESDGSIRMIPMRPGIFELTIDAFGVSETFRVLFVDETGGLAEKEHGKQESVQSQAPAVQQIRYDYDPANAISYSALQSEVDTKRKAEANGSFAGFDKYLVEDPVTNGLVSSAEIKALKSGSGEKPNSVTYAQAVEDVDLLFRTMKVGYGAYYFFGEEKWEQAEAEVMNWLNGQANVSTKELQNKLRNSTAFMRDAHSWIGKNANSIAGFRYEYYYCTGHDFSKDENGFYKEKDGVKWYYESCDNGAVSIEPSLKQNGVMVYSPVLFSPWYATSSQITLTNGTEKRTETVVWNLSVPYSDAVHGDPDFKYIEESGIAYMSIRNFKDKIYPQVFEKFARSGMSPKDAKVFIIDIRANGGGNGKDISTWFKNFTGKELSEPMVRADRDGILNGEAIGKSIYLKRKHKANFVNNQIPIILLVDDECGSAGESMLFAVKMMTNVLVIGSNSAGFQIGGNAVDVNLPNSQIPACIGTMLRFRNQIKNVDGIGYEPDVWCNPKTALSASLNLIKQYGLADEAAVSEMAGKLGVGLN